MTQRWILLFPEKGSLDHLPGRLRLRGDCKGDDHGIATSIPWVRMPPWSRFTLGTRPGVEPSSGLVSSCDDTEATPGCRRGRRLQATPWVRRSSGQFLQVGSCSTTAIAARFSSPLKAT